VNAPSAADLEEEGAGETAEGAEAPAEDEAGEGESSEDESE
jgi:large subunit ribosomal protein L25